MNRNRIIVLFALIVFVLIGAAVAVVFLFPEALPGVLSTAVETPEPVGVAPEEPRIETTEVIVALQPIARGQQFVAGSIGRRSWPKDNVPPDVIADEAETIGRVARTEIVQGQVIVRSMLTEIGETGEASLLVPSGHVAVAYPISEQQSVAYAIQPGDTVDILVSAAFVDVDEVFQSRLPNKTQLLVPNQTIDENGNTTLNPQLLEPIDEGRIDVTGTDDVPIPVLIYGNEPQIPRRVSQLTVEAAKVIRVGPWITPPPAPAAPPAEGEGNAPPPTPTPNLPDIVTLAVTPQNALVLLWLREGGVYSEMALRSANEENAVHKTEAVTLQYMLTRFDIAVPPRIDVVMDNSQNVSELISTVQSLQDELDQLRPQQQR